MGLDYIEFWYCQIYFIFIWGIHGLSSETCERNLEVNIEMDSREIEWGNMDWSGSGWRQVESYCEHGNASSVSAEFLGALE
jgi:hypothetical protein